MDEARSQLVIRKGLLNRPRVTGDTRGARDARRSRSFALARIGRFRPRRPSSMSSRPGLVPRASTSSRPSLEQGHPNSLDRQRATRKAPCRVGLPHGIEGMVELGSRGQPELVRAGSDDLPPSMGLDQPPDGAHHFTNWSTVALSLTRKASVRVDVFEETGERGLRGHKPGDRWRETLGFGWHPNQLFRVGMETAVRALSHRPPAPPYRTAAGCRAQFHQNRLIGGLHRAA